VLTVKLLVNVRRVYSLGGAATGGCLSGISFRKSSTAAHEISTTANMSRNHHIFTLRINGLDLRLRRLELIDLSSPVTVASEYHPGHPLSPSPSHKLHNQYSLDICSVRFHIKPHMIASNKGA
jgi:hypothetical protein